MTQELNLANLLQTLRRRWLLIALVLIVTVGATFVYSLLRPPTYQARSVLRVRVPQFQWNIDPAVQRIIDTKREGAKGGDRKSGIASHKSFSCPARRTN